MRPASQQITLADVDEVVPFEPSPARRGPRASSTYFGREVFHKLEVFNLRGYERVIYLDCDTVVLDDISPLWDPGEYRDLPFYAVRETAEQGVHPATRGKLNTGVMVINRPLLDGRAHDQMLTIADSRRSYDGGDQGVVNAYLENAGHGIAGELDPSYNVLVRAKRFGKWELLRDRIRILHYVNRWKPWSENHARDWLFDPELKRLWDDAYRVPQRRAGGSGAPRP
ncbi:MAG TPA: glycosyltransferase [Thermoanaerobaculia bacterium]|nr:glycosyltransferase [Thermoanaerobaculia bacterium]